MPSPELLANEQLAAEMASISVVHSEALVESTKSTAELNRYQNELDNSKDRVQSVKETLVALKDYEVTPNIVEILDNSLARSEVEIQPADGLSAVEGFESLGLTLMPKDFLFTRLMGVEGFLDSYFAKSRQIATQVSTGFKEAFILFTQTQETLEKAIDLLENSVNTSPPFDKNAESLLLGSRLFNLFKVNGKISENWVGDLDKLLRTVAGLSNNYYLNSRNNLNSIMSFFGGFSNLDQVSAEERFKLLGTSIPSERFKECTYPNSTYSVPGATAKQSVELMGGAYFFDVRQDNPKRVAKSLMDVDDFIERYIAIDRTGFDNNAPKFYPDLDLEVKALTLPQIKAVIRLLRDVHKEWRKVYEGGEKYKLSDADYIDITKSFYTAPVDDAMKDKLLSSFSALVRKNQLELLAIRAAVNNYLVLINTGMVELCHTSIKISTP